MSDAIAAFLEGRGPLPEHLAWLTSHVELAVLARLCRGSRVRSMMAASTLVEALADIAPTPPPTPPPTPTPTPTPTLRSAVSQAEDRVLRILALEEDIARLAPWLEIGWHREGSALVDVVHDRLADIERLLARAPAIRAIADLVGRLEASRRKGRGAERGGRESVVGVTLGGELADVLPSELALLSDPDTEDLFLLRLAERRLLSLELEGESLADPRDLERRGPALVCVDTSGSMIGAAEELGKAATLAILKRILGEGRRAEVVLVGGAGSMKTLAFKSGQASVRALFDLLMSSYHGGTDFDGPLAWALERRRTTPALANADIVMISDGRGRLHPGTSSRLQAARAQRPHPLRLVFVQVDTRDLALATAKTPRTPDFSPFVALADDTVVVRADGSATPAR